MAFGKRLLLPQIMRRAATQQSRARRDDRHALSSGELQMQNTLKLLPLRQANLNYSWRISGLTQFGGRFPAQAASKLSTAIMPIFVRVPTVALPRCGASTTFSSSARPDVSFGSRS